MEQLRKAMEEDEEESIMSPDQDRFSLACLEQCLRSIPTQTASFPALEESVEVLRSTLQKGQATRYGHGGGSSGSSTSS